MRKPKIIFDFLRNSDANLDIQTRSILDRMANNQYFPTPMPALAELTTAHDQYSAALSAAQGRDSIAVRLKDKCRGTLELLLKRLANYVMLVAGDDRAIMASSGFTVSSETVTRSTMGQVSNLDVEVGKQSGRATVSVDAMGQGVFFTCFFAVATDPLVWQFKSSKYPTIVIDGLLPLTNYLFRVVAQGADDATSETGVVTKGVL